MAPRSRLLLLARSYAHACSSQGRRPQDVPVRGKTKVRAYFKGRINPQTVRCIEKTLHEQELKLIELQGELNVLDGRIEGEAQLYKLKEQKDSQNLECAIHEVKFNIMKGAAIFIGISAAMAALVANVSRISDFFSTGGKNGPGKESN